MNIFVSNLPLDITDEHLKELFMQYGEVTLAHVLRDRFNGYSKGKAYVEMPDEQVALQAISELNGMIIGGQAIEVKKALAKEERLK